MFVTATGTAVGKTVVAGVIARTAADSGRGVAVFKPAVSGLDGNEAERSAPDHEHLRTAARSVQSEDEIAPYRYGPAVSPHLAAEMRGEEIDASRLRAGYERALGSADFLVCEGVGGFMVPLRLDYLVRDFARDAGLPVVVVATPGLGTINHTLLTLAAVRAAELEVVAVVFSPWPQRPTPIERSNLTAVEHLGETRVVTLEAIDVSDPGTWPALTL